MLALQANGTQRDRRDCEHAAPYRDEDRIGRAERQRCERDDAGENSRRDGVHAKLRFGEKVE